MSAARTMGLTAAAWDLEPEPPGRSTSGLMASEAAGRSILDTAGDK